MVLIVIGAHVGAVSPVVDVFPTVVGGIVAGFMVSRRVAYNHVMVGLLIGVSSFFMSTLFILLIFRTVEGLLWMWLGFLVGGAVGGMLSVTVRSRASRRMTNQKPADSS